MYHIVRLEVRRKHVIWHVIRSFQDAASAARMLEALRAAEITRSRFVDYRIAILKEDD